MRRNFIYVVARNKSEVSEVYTLKVGLAYRFLVATHIFCCPVEDF